MRVFFPLLWRKWNSWVPILANYVICFGVIQGSLCYRMPQELLLKMPCWFSSQVCDRKDFWALLCRVSPSWNMGCLWSRAWRPAPPAGQETVPQGRAWTSKGREKEEAGSVRQWHLAAGIKACVWCVPCPFWEHRVEIGELALHRGEAHSSMIQLDFKWDLFHLVEKEIQLASLTCLNLG